MNEETSSPADLAKYPVSASPAGTRRRRYLEFLRSYSWVLLLTVTAAVCGMAFYLRSLPPTFASDAYLWVSGKVNIPQGTAFMEELQFFYGTQIRLLQSPHLHLRALNRLRATRPEVSSSRVRLQVVQEPRSAMFKLQADGADPVFTQIYLDALIESYLDYKKGVRESTSDDTLKSIAEQVSDREKELRGAQEKVDAYARTNSIAILQTDSSAVSGYIAKLNAELGERNFEYQLLDVAAVNENQTNGTNGEVGHSKVATVLSTGSGESPEIAAALRQIRQLKEDREEWSVDLKSKHPKIQKLDKDIEKAEKLVESYRSQTHDQLATRKDDLKRRIENLDDKIAENKKSFEKITNQLAEYERLKRDVETSRSFYERMHGMLQTVDTTKKLDQETISVFQKATEGALAKPDFPRQLGIAALIGLLVGLGIILLVERLDDRFTTINELVELFDEEIIGQVPETVRNRSTRRIDLVKSEDPRHIFAESYRNIRSSLLFMAVEGERPKVLLVTSGVPNEGKSTVAANLARTIAFSGAKVLLIDADLRRGGQHQLFGCPRDPGLAEYLRQPGKLDDVVRPTELENLFLIPAGKPIENAGEHFLSSHFDTMLREVRARYDYVIIDSPPVFAADDATTLAPKIDGVLFIMRGSFTRARLARQALDLLYQRQAKVLGLVFNRANTSSRSYYYYKYADYYRRKGNAG